MTQLYPMRFTPVFKERIWGGRKLARWFSQLPAGPVGEAWVLSGHSQGPTEVANGPLAGQTLARLSAQFGADLLGTHAPAGPFPLLFKLLDCQDDLSIQVHPDDSYAGLPPGELGKTEMWVVLEAEPGAQVVYGLKAEITAERFAAAVAEGRTMDAMRTLSVRQGDVLYVPAGTVHALGKGLLVAEIQQSSDTTYRVFDYDRLGLDGQPRELHVAHALNVTRYGEPPAPGAIAPGPPNQWRQLVTSPYFQVAHGQCQHQWLQQSAPESFQVLFALSGEGTVAWASGSVPLTAGATVLVPAVQGAYTLTGSIELLRVTLP